MLLHIGHDVAARARGRAAGSSAAAQQVDARQIVVAGVGVGLLTGFFGVGGGCSIVPLLTLWLRFSFRRAVATSLVIITLTSVAALAAHRRSRRGSDVPVTLSLALSTGVGALIGTLCAQRVPGAVLGAGGSPPSSGCWRCSARRRARSRSRPPAAGLGAQRHSPSSCAGRAGSERLAIAAPGSGNPPADAVGHVDPPALPLPAPSARNSASCSAYAAVVQTRTWPAPAAARASRRCGS